MNHLVPTDPLPCRRFGPRARPSTLSVHGWTELEWRAMTTWRWWSTDDLTSEDVQVLPDNLVD